MNNFNLAMIVKNSAHGSPHALAIRTAASEWTYAELWFEVGRVAQGLSELQIALRSHIALFMPNIPEFSLYYFGTLMSGRIVVPVNPMLKAQELTDQLLDAETEVIVSTVDLLPTIAKSMASSVQLSQQIRTIVVTSPTARVFELAQNFPEFFHKLTTHTDLVHNRQPLSEPFTNRPNDTAVILYTSGTTGRPKGAELTHQNLSSNVAALVGLKEKLGPIPWNALLVLPLFHSFGQTVIQNTTLSVGGSITFMERYDPLQVAQCMKQQDINVFAGVPTMYYGLLNHPGIGCEMLASLRVCLCGGAPMPEEVMKRFNRTFHTDIIEAYGLSETSPVASINPPFGAKKIGSIGIPIEGVEFRLVDPQGNIVGQPFTTGELCIRGPNVMKGYYNKPTESVAALSEGWFKTGDLAERDDDGYYRLVDRVKDIIIRGGFNVYPRQIEEHLYSHPDVLEAAVVGIADLRLGEEVCGFVVLKPGAKTTESDLIDFCRMNLAAYKYPRKMRIAQVLPKGPTGKILKRDLKSSFCESDF